MTDQIDFSDYEEYTADESCHVCLGSGFLVVCVDDMCQGLGYCIHGDGEEMCVNCKGYGFVE
jgi:hypothetical protein